MSDAPPPQQPEPRHRKPNMELLDKIREAVLLSAAHLGLFQREPSHQKLRAIVDNISFFHLQDIEDEAARRVVAEDRK